MSRALWRGSIDEDLFQAPILEFLGACFKASDHPLTAEPWLNQKTGVSEEEANRTCWRPETGVTSKPHLTECIYQLVLESQLPHKTVNLTFQLVIVNNKLTILWGSWLSKTIDGYILWDKTVVRGRGPLGRNHQGSFLALPHLQGYLAHKKQPPIGPYSRTMPSVLWCS